MPIFSPTIFPMNLVLFHTTNFKKICAVVKLESWLVVPTHLKNISQIGLFPQVGLKIKIFETTT